MDENKEKVAIPPKQDMFEREEPMDFIITVDNEDDTKAANFVATSVIDGEIVEELTEDELEAYAEGVLNGDEDVKGLMIGKIYDSKDEAENEAMRLIELYAPGEDGDVIIAIESAKADKGEAEEPIEEEVVEEPPIGGEEMLAQFNETVKPDEAEETLIGG